MTMVFLKSTVRPLLSVSAVVLLAEGEGLARAAVKPVGEGAMQVFAVGLIAQFTITADAPCSAIACTEHEYVPSYAQHMLSSPNSMLREDLHYEIIKEMGI